MKRLGIVALSSLLMVPRLVAQDSASPPTIISVSPQVVAPGTTVAIAIGGFPEDTEVTVSFDGLPAEVVSTSRSLVTVLAPKGLTEFNANPLIHVVARDRLGAEVSASARDVVKTAFPEASASTSQIDRVLSAVFSWPGVSLIVALIAAAAGLYAPRLWREGAAKTPVTAAAAPSRAEALGPLQLPAAVVPPPLLKALESGEAVAYVGAGLSAQAGIATWSVLLIAAVDDLAERGALGATGAAIIRDLVARDRAADAADALWREARADVPAALERLVSGARSAPTESHRELVRLPFASWITTNFDTLLEDGWSAEHRTPLPVLTHRDSQRCLDALSRGERMLLKLSGKLDDDESLLIGAHQLREAVRVNESLSEVISRFFYNRTLFFVGASLQGVEDFMQAVNLRGASPRRHFALVAVDDVTWESRAAALRERYGVEVIALSLADQGGEAVGKFLRELRKEHGQLKTATAKKGASSTTARRDTFLRGITLDNVGAFQHLELTLNREWNLLLGDNGVGKSTVLKAIAVALMGGEAAPYAERIIRRGSEDARITLTTNTDATYTTWIKRRTSGGVAIECLPTRASDQEDWLSIGFPALRTVTWDRPAGEGGLGARRPTAADLAPLLADKADPRLDALKQRIVTLDHLSKNEQLQSSERHHTRLLSELWATFAELVGDQAIAFDSIDPQKREIRVKTADGVVPIEALSQGTISMLSWVGVLLQRLYEVTPDNEDPKQRYGIVLIDEIDSHLHPAWQLSVVRSLSKAFPRIQFIATTHSPLVVRGMDIAQVFRFKRNAAGVVECVDVASDMTMGRPDQVLAGTLFDVDADLDAMTEEMIKEYQQLLATESRNEKEQKRYKELEELLQFRIPVSATSPPDRRARELVDALIEEHVAQSAPETKTTVRDRAHALLTEVEREQTNREVRS